MGEKFSVLMSLYKNEKPAYLAQALDSVISQTVKPAEIVMVKDGSLTEELDKTLEKYCAKYPGLFKIVPFAQNRGLGLALRDGVVECSFELIARMDTDDICKPERFARQLAFMESHPEISVVGAWIDEFQETISNVTSTRKLPQNPQEIRLFGKKRNPMNHPVTMFRKQAVEAAGGYLPFPLFEDYYLWVRMMLNGSKMYNIPESLLYFRFSPEMCKRRGGWKYAYVEMRFQRQLQKLGYIGILMMMTNICIRLVTRLVPNSLRGWIYKKFLRK